MTLDSSLALIPVGIIFLVLGLLMSLRPKWLVKLQVWQAKNIYRAKLIPSKRTFFVTRVLGIIFLILGLFMLGTSFILSL